jgi:hypothetical protein
VASIPAVPPRDEVLFLVYCLVREFPFGLLPHFPPRQFNRQRIVLSTNMKQQDIQMQNSDSNNNIKVDICLIL